ncbi:MAG: UDP-N-acetylmuramate--L-alanine ligase, partial [Armatimonadetes bacterium]|nr:UDP-N-acetylmuramate--L-alanine ligase [Armatimonadota bacterium]
GRQVVVVFQPHLYSRTEYLMDDFAQSFGDADAVIITDIYPAREDPIPGITAEVLASRVAEQRGTRPTAYLSGFEQIADHLRRNYSDGWAILIMGAGDVRKIGEELVRGAPAHA